MKKMNKYARKSKVALGFTLIELMVVVVIIAILAVIAVPSYQAYIRRSHLSEAKQEAHKIAIELERFRAKNFTYKNFDASLLYLMPNVTNTSGTQTQLNTFNATNQVLVLPLQGTVPKYTLSILDGDNKILDVDQKPTNKPLVNSTAKGTGWHIAAYSHDPRNESFILNSQGDFCSKVAATQDQLC